MKLLELFGGIGACSSALDRLNINYEIVDYVEIDKYAVNSYNAIHNTNFKPQDVKEWNKKCNVDLLIHGSPCQDFSGAGKNKGGDENSCTQSSLMYESIRIIEKIKPKIVIWENVKNVTNKIHMHNFFNYLKKMNDLGYNNSWNILNAKDFGIPQNRERMFVISIKSELNYTFMFPEKQPLHKKVQDLLEHNVDDKYLITDKMKHYIVSNNTKWSGNNNRSLINKTIASTINTKEGGRRCDASNFICDELNENYDIKFIENIERYKIRKLTPFECWRLMGFDDETFMKVKNVNSNTQLYKQAGNSIVVDVLVAILRQLKGVL